MLSESAIRLLTALRAHPHRSLCPECAARDLALMKWDVVKLIRELIGSGGVLCSYALCLGCSEQTLVVRVRRDPWAASTMPPNRQGGLAGAVPEAPCSP